MKLLKNGMQELARKTGLTHDDDDRLFDDVCNINVFANDMTKEQYAAMEKDINNFTLVGKGFEVYAWNDCSGYSYWQREGEMHCANYIKITASIKNPKLVNVQELKEAIEQARNHFWPYHNIDYHDFNKRSKE